MSLKSFFKKKTSSQKKILREVEEEATAKERKKIELALAAEQKKKQAEDKKRKATDFLKDVEAAKARGVEKAQVGSRTVTINKLRADAKTRLTVADAKLTKAKTDYKKAEKIGSKALDIILGPKESKKKKTTKRKPASKKKTVKKAAPRKKPPAKKTPAKKTTKKKPTKKMTDKERERLELIKEGKEIARTRRRNK